MADAENLKQSPVDVVSFWGVEPRVGEDGFSDINFRVHDNRAPLEQRVLKNDVERVLSVIKRLYHAPADRSKFDEAFSKLLALAQVGLVGRNASPAIAADALRSLEADVTAREAGPVKNQYMRTLGLWALALAGCACVALGLVQALGWYFKDFAASATYVYKNLFLVWAGCMAGTWASFATRKVTLSFSDLVMLEEDKIDPPLRLVFTGVLTVVLALTFSTGIANIQVGHFQASAILSSGSVAFLVGCFAGLAEKALPSAILSRADSIVSSAASK
ncbi:hypothetical protein KZ813_17780 [Sphingomonas sp. RHCKR7]|uniref:hypothetical protein n=1 Tax=Sphingomonas folli TaxID=2862497 RepID=UPI001CA56FF7|nr:hypothetical protein [Sphingomonas folli]MBW6528696.1 hypothetical protein [Sphingomonas folli]